MPQARATALKLSAAETRHALDFPSKRELFRSRLVAVSPKGAEIRLDADCYVDGANRIADRWTVRNTTLEQHRRIESLKAYVFGAKWDSSQCTSSLVVSHTDYFIEEFSVLSLLRTLLLAAIACLFLYALQLRL